MVPRGGGTGSTRTGRSGNVPAPEGRLAIGGGTLDLAGQFRSAKPAEREKLRADLAVSVDKHFEVRQQRRELQLRRMEEELKRLRGAIELRHKGREQIVQKRLRELVGDPQDLVF